MILGFKMYLKKPILDGTKIHTMREDKPDRWKKGCSIQMVTGVRTAKYDCFMDETCRGTQLVLMVMEKISVDNYKLVVSIDRRLLTPDEIKELSLNDGFSDVKEFQKFFFPQDGYGRYKQTVWGGKLIHWTDKKY